MGKQKTQRPIKKNITKRGAYKENETNKNKKLWKKTCTYTTKQKKKGRTKKRKQNGKS